ncbi:MAG: hypothetical protein VB032_02545 [Burkholderiaceae bacterium]|nr:hypothetical protein [Burkholderiaceae bacterium]
MFSEHSAEQILYPESGIYPTDDVRTSFLQCGGWQTVPVNREIHQETGLLVNIRFKSEFHLAGNDGLIQISCLFHRSATNRLGKHVITNG